MADIETKELDTTPAVEPAGLDDVAPASLNEKRVTGQKGWILFIVGILVGGLAGFFLYPVVVPQSDAAPLAAVADSGQINKPDAQQTIMTAVADGSRHFQGDPKAPITLIEFADFNCGYCGKWTAETLPRLDEKYIQTGKMRMAYVHYPVLGADSMTAAQATECAAQQDTFWDYHNLLYANQGIGFSPANLTKLAGDIGLDTQLFEECLGNFTDMSVLEDDIRLARTMGVRGTPAFLINGIPLAGAYPFEDFERIIEGILAGEF